MSSKMFGENNISGGNSNSSKHTHNQNEDNKENKHNHKNAITSSLEKRIHSSEYGPAMSAEKIKALFESCTFLSAPSKRSRHAPPLTDNAINKDVKNPVKKSKAFEAKKVVKESKDIDAKKVVPPHLRRKEQSRPATPSSTAPSSPPTTPKRRKFTIHAQDIKAPTTEVAPAHQALNGTPHSEDFGVQVVTWRESPEHL